MPEQLPQAIEAVIIEARQFLVDEIDSTICGGDSC